MDQSGTLDQILNDFDEAWSKRSIPSIDTCLLSPDDPRRRELLIELVMIDLEYRWRLAAECMEKEESEESQSDHSLPWYPLLRDYQRCFPALGTNNSLPPLLIAEEYRVRRRWGDRPSHDQYMVLYGLGEAELSAALKQVDNELSNLETRPHQAAPPSLISDLSAPTSSRSTRPKLQVGDQIDEFRLLNKLGSGSFAEVFLAQQKSMQRLVALKVSQAVSHEPKVLSKLDHPNIVRVFDERRVDGLNLLYMQYVSGGDLREILDHMDASEKPERSGRTFLESIHEILEEKGEIPSLAQRGSTVQHMDWATTVAWLGAGLADALRHAHDKGVFHRDIKLENILVTAAGRPMLVDFNLSFGQVVGSEGGRDLFGGSLAYMSPQQLEVVLGSRDPHEVSASSDFYSLAIVLWELLLGRRPFDVDAEQANTTVENMLESRLQGPDIRELSTRRPGGLRKTIVDCLSPSYAEQPRPAPAIVRQLHQSLLPEVDQLFYPDPDSQAAKWVLRPTFWILLYGLLPNIIVSLINIWANRRLTIENFDRQLFFTKQLPVINTVTFSVGMILVLVILWPVLKALWKGHIDSTPQPELKRIAYRCLSGPVWIAIVILALWISSGIAFPWWNRWSTASQVGLPDFLVFFSSQVLHGLIAASMTFVFISLVFVSALFPQFLAELEDPEGQRRLELFRRHLVRSNTILGLTPLLAIMVLALSDRSDKSVFVMLAVVGFAGHWITSNLIPTLSAKLDALKLALAPTSELVNVASRGTGTE